MAYSYKRWLTKRENQHAPVPARDKTLREENLIGNVLAHARWELQEQYRGHWAFETMPDGARLYRQF